MTGDYKHEERDLFGLGIRKDLLVKPFNLAEARTAITDSSENTMQDIDQKSNMRLQKIELEFLNKKQLFKAQVFITNSKA